MWLYTHVAREYITRVVLYSQMARLQLVEADFVSSMLAMYTTNTHGGMLAQHLCLEHACKSVFGPWSFRVENSWMWEWTLLETAPLLDKVLTYALLRTLDNGGKVQGTWWIVRKDSQRQDSMIKARFVRVVPPAWCDIWKNLCHESAGVVEERDWQTTVLESRAHWLTRIVHYWGEQDLHETNQSRGFVRNRAEIEYNLSLMNTIFDIGVV